MLIISFWAHKWDDASIEPEFEILITNIIDEFRIPLEQTQNLIREKPDLFWKASKSRSVIQQVYRCIAKVLQI